LTRLLVIRFGSLGDLCILTWTLAGLAARREAAGRAHVTLAVKELYAPLLTGAPGVDRVEPLRGRGAAALSDLARRLRSQPFDRIVDAHDVLRSRLLTQLMRRRPTRRLRKDTLARLRLLWTRRTASSLAARLLDRYDRALAAEADGAEGAGAAHLRRAGRPPLRPRLAEPPASARRLGLAPGARWDTKRWPPEHFAELLRGFREITGAPVTIFLGARELAWFDSGPLADAAAVTGGVEVVRARPLPEVAARLAECGTLVTNDSGLLHLAEAVGTPVLACFGPTVREFGYFPLLPASRVLEVDGLACRPCSRNGKRPCHRRDLACLRRTAPETALATLLGMPPWRRDVEAGPPTDPGAADA
jgi:heptosyltransferase-2